MNTDTYREFIDQAGEEWRAQIADLPNVADAYVKGLDDALNFKYTDFPEMMMVNFYAVSGLRSRPGKGMVQLTVSSELVDDGGHAKMIARMAVEDAAGKCPYLARAMRARQESDNGSVR